MSVTVYPGESLNKTKVSSLTVEMPSKAPAYSMAIVVGVAIDASVNPTEFASLSLEGFAKASVLLKGETGTGSSRRSWVVWAVGNGSSENGPWKVEVKFSGETARGTAYVCGLSGVPYNPSGLVATSKTESGTSANIPIGVASGGASGDLALAVCFSAATSAYATDPPEGWTKAASNSSYTTAAYTIHADYREMTEGSVSGTVVLSNAKEYTSLTVALQPTKAATVTPGTVADSTAGSVNVSPLGVPVIPGQSVSVAGASSVAGVASSFTSLAGASVSAGTVTVGSEPGVRLGAVESESAGQGSVFAGVPLSLTGGDSTAANVTVTVHGTPYLTLVAASMSAGSGVAVSQGVLSPVAGEQESAASGRANVTTFLSTSGLTAASSVTLKPVLQVRVLPGLVSSETQGAGATVVYRLVRLSLAAGSVSTTTGTVAPHRKLVPVYALVSVPGAFTLSVSQPESLSVSVYQEV